MKNREMIAALLSCLAWACEDSSSSAAGDPDSSVRGIDDGGPLSADGPETTDLPSLDLAPPSLDGRVEPDAPSGPECVDGERHCAGENDPVFRICADGRFGVDLCPAGEICLGRDAVCRPDGANCTGDERACIDGQPAACTPGTGWAATAPCGPGSTCTGEGACSWEACVAADNRRSNLGCEFLTASLPNAAYLPIAGTSESPIGVVLANASADSVTRVWVYDADGALAPLVGEVTIPPGIGAVGAVAATVFSQTHDRDGAIVERGFSLADGLEIPPQGMAVLLYRNDGYVTASQVRRSVKRVVTDAPVMATQFGPYCCNYSFSNDASLLLPVGALGTDHRVIAVPAWGNLFGETTNVRPATLSILAPENETNIRITLPPGAQVVLDAQRMRRQGDVIELTLGALEVMHLLTELPMPLFEGAAEGQDLTGTRIESERPVSVFSGHECTFYPGDEEACDHLEEQMTPVDTWGSRFILSPLAQRGPVAQSTEAVYWKILATMPTTLVLSSDFDTLRPRPPGSPGVPDCRDHLVDGHTIQLDAGAFCEFGTHTGVEVVGDFPFAVLGIISGQASTGTRTAFGAHAGDPSIFLATPVSQYRTSYPFLAPTTFHTDTVTILATADTRLTLDGLPVSLQGATRIGGSAFVHHTIEITDGAHTLDGDQAFGIVVFAFDDYVSYAFTGGTNLIKR